MDSGTTHRPRREENGFEPGRRNDDNSSSGAERSDSDVDSANEEAWDPPQRTVTGLAVASFMCILSGFIFGFVTEKSRMFEPVNIRGQMVFKRIVYLKVVMAAIASGMFGLSLLAMIPSTYRSFQRVCIDFYSHLVDRGILACCLGGVIMGCGATLAGACPILIFVQLGAHTPNAVYTFVGGLIGALTFGLLKSALTSFTQPFFRSSTNPWSKSSYFITALPLVAMFGMLVFAFELLIPWHAEVKKNKLAVGYLSQRVWQPMVAGVVIGFLQIPLVLGAHNTLGGHSSYSTIVSQVFIGPFKRISPYLAHCRYGFRNWSQVFFVCGVILGAYSSTSCSGSFGVVKGVEIRQALIGGFMLTFGAQMTGGSTNAHGQTGMGLLSILSFITMTCFFGSAIVTGFVMSRYKIINPTILP